VTSARPTLVWFRDDLRVTDHPALHAALERGRPVVAAFVLDEISPGRAPGAAGRWWLHHSLLAHRAALDALGIPLVLLRGAASDLIPWLVSEIDADAVTWNRRYGPARVVDASLKAGLREAGVDARSFAGDVLAEPQEVHTASGTPYRVFTPFWNTLRGHPVASPLPAPDAATGGTVAHPDGYALDDLLLLPREPDWAGGLRAAWTPGEHAARERLTRFAAELGDYSDRDLPAVDATSHLSPRLRWGELSPRQVWHRIRTAGGPQADAFLRQLGWRDFFRHTLFHEPRLATRNLRTEFDRFPWAQPDPAELRAWQQGRTGIPLVDAGMRELWQTGVMHNRVRMSAASFLIKNLLIDWRVGEQWFWDTLVDADEASNPGNWQWVAGSGQDAAPYFRIFNPERQAARFDPDGVYLRRWIPELGTDEYPEPVVDLAETRERALAAYDTIKRR